MTSNDPSQSDEATIVRAVLQLARRLRHPVPDGEVSGSALALLASLQRDCAMSAVALARSEGLQPQSLSRLLSRLEGDGLIERPTDPADRRRQLIALTTAGAVALRQAMDRRRQWLAHAIFDRLDEVDRRTLVAASEVMLRLVGPAEDDERE